MAKLETRLSSNCGVGLPHLASPRTGKRRRCWVSVLVGLDACL